MYLKAKKITINATGKPIMEKKDLVFITTPLCSLYKITNRNCRTTMFLHATILLIKMQRNLGIRQIFDQKYFEYKNFYTQQLALPANHKVYLQT